MSYVPGKTYEIATIADMVNLYRSLPAERGDLMLDEVTAGIRLAALNANLTEAVGLKTRAFGGARWIDQDKGEITVNMRNTKGEGYTFKLQRGGTPPTPPKQEGEA